MGLIKGKTMNNQTDIPRPYSCVECVHNFKRWHSEDIEQFGLYGCWLDECQWPDNEGEDDE